MEMRPEKGDAPEGEISEASNEVTQPITEGFNVSDSKDIQAGSQPTFSFGENKVRVIVRDGEPWFVASDVCGALDYKNTSKAVADHLDEDEKSNQSLGLAGKPFVVINESGLYALVLRSRKPEARKFAKWVTSEVLPSIRKTGQYTATPYTVQPSDTLNEPQQIALRAMLESNVKRLPHAQQVGAMVKGWSKLKSHFGVPYRQIPASEFEEALSIIARHVSEWELVDEAPKAGQEPTMPELVAKMVEWVNAPNGYPVHLFVPVYEAVHARLQRAVDIPKVTIQDATRTHAAFDAATRAAAEVQRTVFDAVMHGNDNWKHQRLLLAFITDSAKTAPAYVQPIEPGSFVSTWPRLTDSIRNGECLREASELIEMASACMQRLQQRSGPTRLAA